MLNRESSRIELVLEDVLTELEENKKAKISKAGDNNIKLHNIGNYYSPHII